MDFKKIKQARKAKGYSQVNLAIELGVSVITIQLWERGASHPSPENEEKLRKFLEE